VSNKGVEFLKDYYRKYWNRIEEARTFIPPRYLTEDLKSVYEVVIYECIDGYVTLMYLGKELSVSAVKTSRTVKSVCDTPSLHKLQDSQGKVFKNTKFVLKMEGAGSLHVADAKVIVEHKSGLKTVYRPPWLRAHVIQGKEPQEFLLITPSVQAENDIKTLVFAQRLQVEKSDDIVETRESVITKLEGLLNRFNGLLEDATKESELQDFIKQNSFIVSPFGLEENVYPKYQLGKELETDFVIENKPPMPFSHTFVEIEPASELLFLSTKGRELEFMQRANHAISQLMDWRIWVRDNIAYVRRDFPSMDQCDYLLVMGRSTMLSEKQKRKLAELNTEHNWRTILTYDDLADKLKVLIANLKTM